MQDGEYIIKNARRGEGRYAKYVYACLYNHEDRLVISSTLDYIETASKRRGYNVVNLDEKLKEFGLG